MKEQITLQTKVCTKCGKELTTDNFRKDKSKKDGLYSSCKLCCSNMEKQRLKDKNDEINTKRRKMYKENIEHKREVAKKYRENHKDKIKEWSKKNREKHKEEIKEKAMKYRKEHREELNARQMELYYNNHDYNKAKKRQYYEMNREYILEQQKKNREEHREEINKKHREWYQTNKKEFLQKQREYKEQNKERFLIKRREWYQDNKERINKELRERKNNDAIFKLKTQIRKNVQGAFKRTNHRKTSHTAEIVGMSLDDLTTYLKQTWFDNYGYEWNGEPCHIDHVVPLDTATTEQEVYDSCHYTNLQLLKPEDNMVKSNKLDWSLPINK